MPIYTDIYGIDTPYAPFSPEHSLLFHTFFSVTFQFHLIFSASFHILEGGGVLPNIYNSALRAGTGIIINI